MKERTLAPVLTREGSPRTIQDLVAYSLRRWVADGTLRPGDRINVEAVAESVGCSIIPVREALRMLVKENIITIIPHRGAFVRALSSDEIAEVYWLRQTLETRALAKAVPDLAQEDLVKLWAMVEEMDRVIEMGDVLAYMAIDSEFHLAMYRRHNSSYLVGLCEDAYHASHAYRLAHAALPGRARQGNLEHRELLNALQGRDTAEAQAIMSKHLSDTANYLIEYLLQQEKLAQQTA
jgi:DNA-binding GntR family transcriptional regulator